MVKKTKPNIEDQDVLEKDVLDNLSDEEIDALVQDLDSEDNESESEEIEEGTTEADVDGITGMENNYKTNMMSIAMKKLAGATPDQVAFFLASLDQIGHEADTIAPGAAATNQASIAMKGNAASAQIAESLKAALKEDLSTVFGDSKELTEEFKEKITTLFEAAVSYRVTSIEQTLLEQYNEAFEEEVAELSENLIQKIDEYMSYAAEEWMAENEVAIQHSLKTEIAEDFITDLKALFEHHNIDIPSEKVDIAEARAQKVEELEEKLNTTLEDNMELTEAVEMAAKGSLITEFTTGMTLSQTEKFKQLIDTIDYDGDEDSFVEKMKIIKESHFDKPNGSKPRSTNIITEEISYSPEDLVEEEKEALPNDPSMRQYVKALNNTV